MKQKTTNNNGLRILLDVALVVSVVLLPWWWIVLAIGSVLLLLAGAYEAILFGVMWDIYFAAPVNAFFGIQYLMTSAFIIAAILGFVVRRVLRVRYT